MPHKDLEVRRTYMREYQKQWAAEHRDELRVKRKKYAASNQRSSKLRYERNKAVRLAQTRKWQSENEWKDKAAKSAWRKAMLELQREWRKRNPIKIAEKSATRRARANETQCGKISFAVILKKANGLCGICGDPFDLFGIHFDHIVPLSRGGTHTEDNLQATHARCNLM